jgi:hypothetical protein
LRFGYNHGRVVVPQRWVLRRQPSYVMCLDTCRIRRHIIGARTWGRGWFVTGVIKMGNPRLKRLWHIKHVAGPEANLRRHAIEGHETGEEEEYE